MNYFACNRRELGKGIVQLLAAVATEQSVPFPVRLLLTEGKSNFTKEMLCINQSSQKGWSKWPVLSEPTTLPNLKKMLAEPILEELTAFRDLSILVNQVLGTNSQQRNKILDAAKKVHEMKKNFFTEQSIKLYTLLSFPDDGNLWEMAPQYGLTTMANLYKGLCERAIERGSLSPEQQEKDGSSGFQVGLR